MLSTNLAFPGTFARDPNSNVGQGDITSALWHVLHRPYRCASIASVHPVSNTALTVTVLEKSGTHAQVNGGTH